MKDEASGNRAQRIGIAVAAGLVAVALIVLLPRGWAAAGVFMAIAATVYYLLTREARSSFLLRQQLLDLATHDPQTGLMNRRGFGAHLDAAWLQAQRGLTSLGLMVLDIDHFKRINEVCGQPFADNALQHVGQVLRRSALRPMDAAARYGDDEFVAIWFEVDGVWLSRLAEEMPARLGILKGGAPGNLQSVTVSGGAVLAWPRPGLTAHDALKAAEQLMRETRQIQRGTVGYKVLRPASSAQEKSAA